MLRIKPFAALRPRPELAHRVASVPFDVVTTEEARELAKNEPLSFLHVVRSEIDLPVGADIHGEETYRKAAENFRKLQSDGVLIRESSPCLYLYRQQEQLFGRLVSQTGLVCCCRVQDYESNLIRKHEVTRRDKEDDRTRHVLALDANAGPVFVMYRGRPEIDELVRAACALAPLYDFTAPDGVRHTVWRVEQTQSYLEAFGRLPCAYVADGHHRSAAAARAAAELRQQRPGAGPDAEHEWFLTVLFPADQLNILSCPRVVKDLNGMTAEAFLQNLSAIGAVTEAATAEPERPGSFGVYLTGKWRRFTLPEARIDRSDPVSSLDYVLLTEHVLRPILGIADLRTDKRIDFLGGAESASKARQRVESGECAVAFTVRAVTVDELISVADANRIMPPKSTWFEPKLRSGLLVHTLG